MVDHQYLVGDCLSLLKDLPDQSVDLVFCSPPYEDARLYGELNYKVKGQDWVDWCVPRFQECLRVCRGLVAWVVEGKTRQFRWSATPALLMADLHRAGVKLRKPPIYRRDGIPGSGGPDWLANKWEWVVCAAHGRLPWADNTAMGRPPRYGPGGAMSNRRVDGSRVRLFSGQTRRRADGKREPYNPCRPMPALANPGNIIDCGAAGGGNIGCPLAHENEAPFPEKLAEFFIRSFCPPDGTVLDCFAGSGTTSCVAKRWRRKSISIDIRESQRDIWGRRIADPRYDPIGDHTLTQRS